MVRVGISAETSRFDNQAVQTALDLTGLTGV
jgi:hypothetical protein